MKHKTKKTFEEMYEIINQVVKKRKAKWKLKAIVWFDFEDIEQIIKIHIHKKWHLWDQKRPIEPWVNRIVSNQIKNIIRNSYSCFVKPCVNCSFNTNKAASFTNEDNTCGFTKSQKQCNECPLYAKWEKTKKNAYDIKMTVSLQNHQNYFVSIPESESVDFSLAEKKLHSLMKDHLTDKQFFAYKMFFIDCLNDDEVAQFLKFKTSEKGRKAGYKQIKNLKKMLYLKAKSLMKENDVFNNE